MNVTRLYKILKKTAENIDKFSGAVSIFPGGDLFFVPTDSYICGVCGNITYSQENAERCCRCFYCNEPSDKGTICHPECEDKYREEQHKIYMDSLTTVDPSRVNWTNRFVFWNDEILYDPGSLQDYVNRTPKEKVPEYVVVSERTNFEGISTDYIIEELDEFCEDGSTYVDGLEDLMNAVKDFNKKNGDFYCNTESGEKVNTMDLLAHGMKK